MPSGGKPGTVLAFSRGGGAQLVRLPRAVFADGAEHEWEEHADEGRTGVLLAGQRGIVCAMHLCRCTPVSGVVLLCCVVSRDADFWAPRERVERGYTLQPLYVLTIYRY